MPKIYDNLTKYNNDTGKVSDAYRLRKIRKNKVRWPLIYNYNFENEKEKDIDKSIFIVFFDKNIPIKDWGDSNPITDWEDSKTIFHIMIELKGI